MKLNNVFFTNNIYSFGSEDDYSEANREIMNILNKNNNFKNARKKSKKKLTKLEIEGQNKGKTRRK